MLPHTTEEKANRIPVHNRTCGEGLADGLSTAVLVVSVMSSEDQEGKHAASKCASQ